ncbi:hypothetical protein [Microbacterium sp. CFBP9034]|uniref:hypothetical protein n=1 Tax=Microbacterium sp. CFBP9034 TaxID=3096540 RepID=UPI002A6B7572|nr:hypothetical protein [Microbacterium sp. CFBP9034]MDY0909190.1 hypothetical protein [Microbacterium sp. CFBP9034]
MTLDAALLLAGPRGRRLCLEYATAAARESGTQAGRDAATAVFWAAHALEGESSTSVLFTSDGSPPTGAVPAVRPEEAASALDSIALPSPSAESLRDALGASVDRAMYWQPPDGADVLASTAPVRGSLARVAELVAASPHAGWWATPVELDDQWAVPWEGSGRPPADPGSVLAAWREGVAADEIRAARERPADPNAPWSGMWWSMPPTELSHSTRGIAGGAPAGLWLVEDSPGWEAATATPLDAFPGRVIEIHGPEEWIDLCRRHPLPVTASRRHDWFRVTGRDGDWVMPDWSRVAEEADGVHVSVACYLATAGRLLDLEDGRASVMAGWAPDTTWWFAGVSAREADAVQWVRDDDDWVPAASER